MNLTLDSQYWENRYQEKTDAWDLGVVSPPIKAIADSLTDKNVKILIPGGGNAHEAEYFHNLGFSNVFVCDLALTPLENLQKRVPTFPKEHCVLGNFFDLEMKFDLIIEQTFFCAINPNLRESYVKQVHNILNDNGILTGLLFDAPLNIEHPPFGGSQAEYQSLFSELFDIKRMELSTNSIEGRLGRELIFEMIKKIQ